MPPPGAERPDKQSITELVSYLENTIDTSAVELPVGRVALLRLNRREYAYAIRDLLGMNVDVTELLPVDDLKDGYDSNAAA